MKDYKFLIGIRLYLIILHYSIFVGYIYGYYKNYNIKNSLFISCVIGFLAPFFLPLHYIIDNYYKDKQINLNENINEIFIPIVKIKHFSSKYNKIIPMTIRT
jgi:hypothetical protein